jgi:hypothetical protein
MMRAEGASEPRSPRQSPSVPRTKRLRTRSTEPCVMGIISRYGFTHHHSEAV